MDESLWSVNAGSVPLDDGPNLDDSDTAVTPAQVLAEMKEVWQNECMAPKLLPHKFPVLECLIDQIEGMEENISRSKDKTQLKVFVHRLETMRISYMCNHYVRTRLAKIEKHPRIVLHEHEQRLADDSDSEKEFAVRFANAHDSLLKKEFLDRLPTSLQKVPVPEANFLYERVFIRALEPDLEPVTVPNLAVPNSEIPLELEKDNVYLVPFVPVLKHLENSKIRLV